MSTGFVLLMALILILGIASLTAWGLVVLGKKSPWMLLSVLAGVPAIAFITLYAAGWAGSTPKRVWHDASVILPRSTAELHCEGAISMTWLWDCVTIAHFKMNKAELPGFFSQLKKLEPPREAGRSSSSFLDETVPWRKGKPIQVLNYANPDGNYSFLEVWPADENSVRIYLLTFWN